MSNPLKDSDESEVEVDGGCLSDKQFAMTLILILSAIGICVAFNLNEANPTVFFFYGFAIAIGGVVFLVMAGVLKWILTRDRSG